jgi:hypothetical protein
VAYRVSACRAAVSRAMACCTAAWRGSAQRTVAHRITAYCIATYRIAAYRTGCSGAYRIAAYRIDAHCPVVHRDVSGSGGRRGEAIRNIYYSDRQLPPGHDPGADSSEAPTAGSVAHGH